MLRLFYTINKQHLILMCSSIKVLTEHFYTREPDRFCVACKPLTYLGRGSIIGIEQGTHLRRAGSKQKARRHNRDKMQYIKKFHNTIFVLWNFFVACLFLTALSICNLLQITVFVHSKCRCFNWTLVV